MGTVFENKTDFEKFEKLNPLFQLISSKSLTKPYRRLHDYLKEAAINLGQDQSFHTIDLGNILWKAQLWKEQFPNISPFYAVKANSDPMLLRLFVLLGYSFDCSTEGEIRKVLEAGGDPNRIVFAHTIKTPRGLRYASSVGVDLLTFDNEEELLKISSIFPSARLLLRIKPESVQCLMDLSFKYGCDLSYAENILKEAKKLNLNVVGVSFHVGGLCENVDAFVQTIRSSRVVFDMAKDIGFSFAILDIGAGFIGKKGTDHLFCEFAGKINETLKENYFDDSIKLIAEPGTFFVASAVTLTTAIIGKRNITVGGDEDKHVERQYYLNDGVYGSFFHTIFAYDLKHEPLITEEEKRLRPVRKSKFWGQTCCCEDMILKESIIPDMNIGEFIVWTNIGAYSRDICSTFTSVLLPARRYVFINDCRLKLELINDIEKVRNLIADNAALVLKE